MAVLRKQRGGYASNLTRMQDELKSLLDNGACVDRVQKRLEQVRTALKVYNFNVKFIQWLEKAGLPEEVPSAELYYVEAGNCCSQVLKLADHRRSVSLVVG